MSRSYAWTVVALLWVVALLNYLDRQVVFSLFPPIQREFQVTGAQLGLLSTAFLWVYGLVSPVAGFLADRFGHKRVIVASLLVWSLVTCATGYARTFAELLLARGLMGISEACYLPAGLALIASYHGDRSRSLATGLHQSGIYFGMILGGAGGGWMGEHYGWRAAFVFLGLAGVAYAAVILVALRDAPAKAPPAGRSDPYAGAGFVASVRDVLARPGYVVLGTVNAMAAAAYWIVYTWMPLHLYERFHMSLTSAGFTATFYIQVASFAGILLGGWVADRWSQRNPRARVLTQAIGFVAAGLFLFLAGTTASRLVLIPSLVAFGLGRGLFDCNLMPVLCQIVPSHRRATGYGVYNLAACIVGGTMAAAAGGMKDSIGLAGAIGVSAVVLCAAGFLLLAVRLTTPGEAAAAEPRMAEA